MAGGALVDPDGSLVGILTHPAQSGPDGLAIPVAAVRDVEDQLDSSGSSGKVTHGWLGVLCNPDASARPGGGAEIQVVMAGSPAEKAGLQAGDVVVRADGSPVSGRPELVAAVRTLRPQDPLDLQYVTRRPHPERHREPRSRRSGGARVLPGDGVNPPIARSPRFRATMRA